jgi:hypothetical protein
MKNVPRLGSPGSVPTRTASFFQDTLTRLVRFFKARVFSVLDSL